MRIVYNHSDGKNYKGNPGQPLSVETRKFGERIELCIRDPEKTWITLVLDGGEAISIAYALLASAHGKIDASLHYPSR